MKLFSCLFLSTFGAWNQLKKYKKYIHVQGLIALSRGGSAKDGKAGFSGV